jgi:hypothetical protein
MLGVRRTDGNIDTKVQCQHVYCVNRKLYESESACSHCKSCIGVNRIVMSHTRAQLLVSQQGCSIRMNANPTR